MEKNVFGEPLQICCTSPMTGQFPGLKAGDKWCLCVSRWIQAHKAGKAPMLILEATHEKTLDYTELNTLVKYAFKHE